MQGKGISLRLGLLALVVVLVLSAVGGLSLAKDAFDGNDYEDCPAVTRLDAVDGLAVDRTDEEKEIRISWDALTDAELSSLGPNGYRARLTVIVEGGSEDGGDLSNNVALGDTSLVVDDVTLASDITISVAITLGNFVISDIAEKDFTSGMPKPGFYTVLKERGRVGAEAPEGYSSGTYAAPMQRFYYLGFNDLFDNWFVAERPATVTDAAIAFETRPSVPKFRVGLAHASGVKPGDADFDHYRIVIEDGSGDLLGYQAQTVDAKRTYGSNRTVFGVPGGAATLLNGSNLTSLGDGDENAPGRDGNIYKGFTNIRLSNQVTNGPAMSPYYASIIDLANAAGLIVDGNAFEIPDTPGDINLIGLSYGNVVTQAQIGIEAAATGAVAGVVPGLLYVAPPHEYFDFPNDVFEDDGAYVIKAWAEDGDGTRISPVASIKLSVREGDSVGNSAYTGYVETAGTRDLFRSWGGASTPDLGLAVYGLSIEDE